GVVQNPQPNSPQVIETSWHLRLQKEGATFTASYSADGDTWTELGSLTNAEVAEDGRAGLFALAASSTQNHTATFDYFRLVEDEPVEPVRIPVDRVSVQLYSLIPWVNADGQEAVLDRLGSIGLENIEPYG